MTFLRLVTVHPILVHLTIGLVPLVVAGYVAARVLKSERWSFVADVALYACAAVTVATAAFGLISYFALDWPGGLEVWKGLHLAFGSATALMLVVLVGYRLGSRKQHPLGSWQTIVASSVIAVFVAFTGWVGGEVLVYRAGMAVAASGDGALAPPITASAGMPGDLAGAMHVLRGSWARVQVRAARMVVERPDPAGFEAIARDAQRISMVGGWLAEHAEHEHEGSDGQPAAALPRRAPVALAQLGGSTHDEDMADDARQLITAADGLSAAARAGDLAAVTEASGRVASVCAECHAEHRWAHHH